MESNNDQDAHHTLEHWQTLAARLSEDQLCQHLDAACSPHISTEDSQALKSVLDATRELTTQHAAFGVLHHYFEICFYDFIGDYPSALRLCRALLHSPRLSDSLRGRTLKEQGLLYRFQGRFDRALASQKAAQQVYLTLGDLAQQGVTQRNQGIIHHCLGQYEQALRCYQFEYQAVKQTGNLQSRGAVLNELGYVMKDLGNWVESQAYYERSLRIWRKLDNRINQARVRNNLGELAHLTGRFDEAETHFSQALAIAEDPAIQNEREGLDMALNLGFLNATQQRHELARLHYDHALELGIRLDNPLLMSQVQGRIGDLHHQQGNLPSAHACYEQAINAIEAMREQVGGQEVKIGVLGVRQYVYQALALLCLEQADSATALNIVERAKSRAFLDLLKPFGLRESEGSRPLTLDEIQACLPADSAVIEFFITGISGPSEMMIRHLPAQTQFLRAYLAPPDQVMAFVITPERATIVHLNVRQADLERDLFEIESGRLRRIEPLADQPLPSTRPWQVLDAALLEPLRPSLHGCRHVFLVPHGVLHYLPLHALNKRGFLPNKTEITISYAPSASVLGRLISPQLLRAEANAPLTCLGVGVDGPGLEQSEAEAHQIADQFSGDVLVGGDATTQNVLREMPNYDVIHFSCHGRFDHTHPMDSSLVLHDGKELTAAHILNGGSLRAKLITLSACNTGLNRLAYGDELLGLTRAFIGAGVQSVVVSLWRVYETPTRLFMGAFYKAWRQGASKARALLHAQAYLRSLSSKAIFEQLLQLGLSEFSAQAQVDFFTSMSSTSQPPFDHPCYWGAFLLIGDPR